MKSLLSILLSVTILFLSGCGGIYSNFRQLEQIRIVQTMGLDYIPGGTELTLASANVEKDSEEALCLSASGASISDALEQIRNSSSQDELFLSHVKQILIGEKAAKQSLEPYFSYICRSSDLRIDIPIFVVKGKTAKETMSGAGGKEKGISEVLEALRSNETKQQGGRIIRASTAIDSLYKSGGCLISMLEYIPASEKSKTDEEPEMTAALSGYAVIKDSSLCAYIDSENALGADFLLNRVGNSDIVVSDPEGKPISMELSSGSSRAEAKWSEEGKLLGIDIYADVRATVLEMQETSMYSEELSDYLISQLESYVSSKISYVLQLSRKLQCDFLGLSQTVKIQDPEKYRKLTEGFSEILPNLEMKISVSGELCHTKDIKDA